MKMRKENWGVSKRPLSLSPSMADQGPWDPGDDAYNGRVSLDDGGEDPPSDRAVGLCVVTRVRCVAGKDRRIYGIY